MNRWIDYDMRDAQGLHCPKCGYELTGLTITRCPECGGWFNVAELIARRNVFPPPSWPATLVTILAALSLVFVAHLSMSAGTPQLWSPFPLAIILPLIALGSLGPTEWIVSISSAALFIAWNIQLLWSSTRIPMRTTIAFCLLGPVNLLWIAAGAVYSWGHHGHAYTVGVIFLNVLVMGLLMGIWLLHRRRPWFSLAVAFHWLAWGWITFCAFPWMGELP